METRRRLLDSTAQLLRSRPYRQLRVHEITRWAQTSPATFYQYFETVEDAIFTLAAEMAEEGQLLVRRVDQGPWTGRAGYETAEGLVDDFISFWAQHRGVLRVIAYRGTARHDALHGVSTRLLNRVALALRDALAENNRNAGDRSAQMAQASVLISMLVTVAAFPKRMEPWASLEGVRRSAARMLYWGVTGRAPLESWV